MRTRGLFRTLVYSELWYIQNTGIFKTRDIFRNLVYSELQDIKKPGISRTLECWKPKSYSEHCQTSTIEFFAKVVKSCNYFEISAFQSWYFKSFDCIKHKQLRAKLAACGFDYHSLNFIFSYHTERKKEEKYENS